MCVEYVTQSALRKRRAAPRRAIENEPAPEQPASLRQADVVAFSHAFDYQCRLNVIIHFTAMN